jgi:flagellar hook-associated protein 3 FlgL
MLLPLKGSTGQYLANLGRMQSAMDTAQREVSSGLRVSRASDDPSALNTILQLQADIASNQQIQSNFSQTTSDLDSADASLQAALKLVDHAVSLATQVANTNVTAAERAGMAGEISSLQQQMLGISQTEVNGRYIFSGDADTAPSYVLDATQPNGVRQVSTAGSTHVIQDINGITIPTSRTAAEIFDAQNPDGTAAAGNVFAALANLVTALNSNDSTAIQAGVTSLKSAGDHLNLQLEFYGEASARVTRSQDLAKKFLVEKQSELSTNRDADIATAAIQLSQATTEQQASLTAQAKISKLSLFDYLA